MQQLGSLWAAASHCFCSDVCACSFAKSILSCFAFLVLCAVSVSIIGVAKLIVVKDTAVTVVRGAMTVNVANVSAVIATVAIVAVGIVAVVTVVVVTVVVVIAVVVILGVTAVRGKLLGKPICLAYCVVGVCT